MSHLLESIQSLISSELISAVAGSTGESEDHISKAMSSMLPSILCGLIQSNPTNHSILNEIGMEAGKNSHFIPELCHDIRSGNASSTNFDIGSNFLSAIFEHKATGISNLISNLSGVQPGAANTLTKIGAAITASFLGQKMLREGLNFTGILHWLGDQRDVIDSALPTSFSGFIQHQGNKQMNAVKKDQLVASGALYVDERGHGMQWLLPLLLIVFLGIGIWYWMMSGQNGNPKTNTLLPSASAVKLSPDSAVSLRKAVNDSSIHAQMNTLSDTLQSNKNQILGKDSLH